MCINIYIYIERERDSRWDKKTFRSSRSSLLLSRLSRVSSWSLWVIQIIFSWSSPGRNFPEI